MGLAQIEGRRADQVADVLDEQDAALGRVQVFERMPDHVRVEMAALAGVDLDCRNARRPDAVGVVGRLLVALDDRERLPALERLYGAAKQGRLARAWTRDEVEGEDTARGELPAVLPGVRIVLGEDVLLQPHHARLAHARHFGAGKAMAIMVQAVVMAVIVVVLPVVLAGVVMMAMIVIMVMVMVMVMAMTSSRLALDPDLAVPAATHSAHQLTSSSLIFISSPPVTCSWWLPQTGHGS